MEEEQKRILIRIGLSAVLFAASYIASAWQLYLIIAAYIIIGYDVLYGALRGIFRGALLDEKFLMGVATVGAFAIGEYPEAVFVMLFYQVGELFQDMAVDKSRRSIHALVNLRPDTAVVLRDGKEEAVSPAEIAVGEHIIVKPGERIPIDGKIIKGSAQLDTAALTGESMPQSVEEGDEVYSGSICLDGVLCLCTTKRFSDSAVSRIMKLVQEASENKARPEAFIKKFARVYTPIVCGTALLLGVIPSIFTGNWSQWVYRGLVFLVVSCPCALVVSVPLAYFGGIGGASRRGILVKGANFLEALADARTFVFDKTGTLTKGIFSVQAVHSDKMDKKALLYFAGAAERYSNHPIAKALRDGEKAKVSDVREYAGEGVEAVVDGKKVYVGNGRLMKRIGLEYSAPSDAGTVVYVAVDGVYAGCIVIADTVKPGAGAAISALRKSGIGKMVMLTGDKPDTAEAVAAAVGIREVHASLMPGEKLSYIERFCAEGVTAYVGDGINDAPSMARAGVGIAMGALGTDAAMEAADIVLMDDDPEKIVSARILARKTRHIVRQNIILSLGVKAAVLLLGAAGLANMWLAAFADVGVSFIAVLNSMRTLKK